MKGALALICLVVFTAGCAAAEQKPSAGDKLYEAVARGSAPELAVIDARSQAADRFRLGSRQPGQFRPFR